MRSKEAVEDLVLYLNANEPTGKFIENVETIKKESEVLKIIKKYYKSNGWGMEDGVVKFWEMKPDELKKVKEYLESGN